MPPELGEVWESDPLAIEALSHSFGDLPAVEVRCGVPKGGGSCGRLLGTVSDTTEGRVLMIFHWPMKERSPSAEDREQLVLFLDKAGDQGLYTCRDHGSWVADLDAVRARAREGALIGHPRVRMVSQPPVSA